MPISFTKPVWYRSGLFWRTFLLLGLLVTISISAWFASVKIGERKPRAKQISGQIISVVTLTRAALTHSDPEKRISLLRDLARNEGIQIAPLEESDRVEEPKPDVFFVELSQLVRSRIGEKTRFAESVNDEEGFWVSFNIDDDLYWLRLDQERVRTESSLQLFGWAAITLAITLVGAGFISRRINEPLSRLSAAARNLAKGKTPTPLIEEGAREIRETNASFNYMVAELGRIESDRAVILAGISHDLRTPITRMQLEVEMAPLDSSTREAMKSDLNQMDSIIQQFLDYAKPLHESTMTSVDLSELCTDVFEKMTRDPQIIAQTNIDPGIHVSGITIELQRLLNNLCENAKRYGRSPTDNHLRLDFECKSYHGNGDYHAAIRFRDYGIGVPESELGNLLRPFTRIDVARSQANGSGLGLAIVDRIVKRHGGNIQIANHPEGGFEIYINL